MYTIFDIEADNLLYDATQIWCIIALRDSIFHIYHVPHDNITYPENAEVYLDINSFLDFLSNQEKLVGHNIIGYDLPLLKKLHGFKYEISTLSLDDTHIMSRLFYPDREEHSLEYFGKLLKNQKISYTDFSKFSQEMLDYCIQDVVLNDHVYKYLLAEKDDWDWTEALKLEYNIWNIQQKQEQHGVLFDVKAATELYNKIDIEIQEIETKVISEVPLRPVNQGELKKIFLKNGDYTTPVKEWIDEFNV